MEESLVWKYPMEEEKTEGRVEEIHGLPFPELLGLGWESENIKTFPPQITLNEG